MRPSWRRKGLELGCNWSPFLYFRNHISLLISQSVLQHMPATESIQRFLYNSSKAAQCSYMLHARELNQHSTFKFLQHYHRSTAWSDEDSCRYCLSKLWAATAAHQELLSVSTNVHEVPSLLPSWVQLWWAASQQLHPWLPKQRCQQIQLHKSLPQSVAVDMEHAVII